MIPFVAHDTTETSNAYKLVGKPLSCGKSQFCL